MISHRSHDQLAWRTSSFSSNGANCVEVLEADGETWLRDTKDRTGGTVHLSATQWSSFVTEVADDTPSVNGALVVRPDTAGGREVVELASGTTLRFTPGEWSAFRSGVLAGEFDRSAA
jgi:hypothetical protein